MGSFSSLTIDQKLREIQNYIIIISIFVCIWNVIVGLATIATVVCANIFYSLQRENRLLKKNQGKKYYDCVIVKDKTFIQDMILTTGDPEELSLLSPVNAVLPWTEPYKNNLIYVLQKKDDPRDPNTVLQEIRTHRLQVAEKYGITAIPIGAALSPPALPKGSPKAAPPLQLPAQSTPTATTSPSPSPMSPPPSKEVPPTP